EILETKLNQLFASMNGINHGNVLPLRAGIYVCSDGDYDVSRACDRAKAACDHLRGQYVSRYLYFNKEIGREIAGKAYVLDNFTRALSEHWIHAYFQRIVDPETGKVTDEEALARWIDPESGMLSPDEFIPILEDEGILWKLDLYMAQEIIQSMREKQRNGDPLVPVSLNLSERDFRSCNMIDKLSRRMDEAGIGRKYLVIEITERAIGRDPELLSKIIEECGKAGFGVWLDDFGSEYSSLNILSSYHFDVIKLDQKFLRSMEQDNQKGKLLVAEILDFTKKAGIRSLAEGVETEEEAAFLLKHGVNKIQGFLYSRPEPEEAVLEWYRNHLSAIQTDSAS
ncbi:MAG: EAL domain-containing protein, partial [Bulleidia sp.]